MKILYDYKIFYQQRFGGISSYFYNLANELKKTDNQFLFYSPLHKNFYFNTLNKQNQIGNYLRFLPSVGSKFYEFINHTFTEKFIKSYKPDIVHETYYSNKKYNSKNKIVCTVYDMTSERYPDFFKNHKKISFIKRQTINRADKIICISKKTKEDLINYFSINENKIEVVYLASGIKEKRLRINLEKKYPNHLLFVGSRRGYKNYNNFISAYAKSKTLRQNFKIIFFGGERVSKLDYMVIKQNKLDLKNFLFLDDKKASLPFLYSNVAALIYPSFYEGFGLPIVEAMSFSCPVISSWGGSLKEIGGDGIEYFNPNEIEDISYKLEKVLFSKKILKAQIEYGIRRSQKFSWEKCATETINVYKNI
jgi:glycosyltransferase involved in cell wall biosynthesis